MNFDFLRPAVFLVFLFLQFTAAGQGDSYLAELELYTQEHSSEVSFSINDTYAKVLVPRSGVQNLLLYQQLYKKLSPQQRLKRFPLANIAQFDLNSLEYKVWKGFALEQGLIDADSSVAAFDLMEGLIGFKVNAFGDFLYYSFKSDLDKSGFTYIPPSTIQLVATESLDQETVQEEIETTLNILATDYAGTYKSLFDASDFDINSSEFIYFQKGFVDAKHVLDAYRFYLKLHGFRANDPDFPTYRLNFSTPFSLLQMGIANDSGQPAFYLYSIRDMEISDANRFAQVFNTHIDIAITKALNPQYVTE